MTRSTPIRRWIAKVWLVASVGVLPASFVWAQEEGEEAAPVPVVLATIETSAQGESSEFVARVEAIESVDIRAQVDGLIADVAFEGGELVAEGDPLFLIEPARYEAALAAAEGQLARAEAALENASLTFARTQELAQRGTLAQASLDEARAALLVAEADIVVARADVQAAQLNLSYTRIEAPIGGRIGLPAFTQGNLVGSGSGALARLVQTDPVYVAFNIPEADMVTLRQEHGMALEETAQNGAQEVGFALRLPNGTDYGEPGEIAVIANEVDTQTGTLTLRVRFANADNILLPGQFVNLIIAQESPEELPLVPQPAVLRDAEGQFVYVVDENGLARQRRIVTASRQGSGWLVPEGLSTGEQVIVEGIQRVVEGAPVADVGSGPAQDEPRP